MDDRENEAQLPARLLDAHFHLLDTSSDSPCQAFNGFFASLVGPGLKYLPSDYGRDVVDEIENRLGIKFLGSVHVEVLPDDGIAEAIWLEQLEKPHPIRAVVASCDLTESPNEIDRILSAMKQQCPLIRGIRWILDVSEENDQDYEANTATHVACTRHLKTRKEYGTIDYMKVPAFHEGFRCLATHGFSFDLQCAPTQLERAAILLEKHPTTPVVIDHFGKPRRIYIGEGETEDTSVDNVALDKWKRGMQRISQLPHVYCKLSMLGSAIPGWHKSAKGQELMQRMLRWVVLDWFGPQRCMVALNWHISAPISDTGGEGSTGPSPVEFITLLSRLLPAELTLEQRNDVFADNACRFYKIAL